MTLTLHLDRWLPAPPERVFVALTDIDELRRWYTCDPGSVWTFHAWDASVGGDLRVTIGGDGYSVDVAGRFRTVEPPHRLVYDWNDELIELRLTSEGDGTRLTLTHSKLATETDHQIRDGGWTHNLTSLVDHLAL